MLVNHIQVWIFKKKEGLFNKKRDLQWNSGRSLCHPLQTHTRLPDQTTGNVLWFCYLTYIKYLVKITRKVRI